MILIFCFFLLFLWYSLFSYALTDPNLVLTAWAPYWQFQNWMWQTFFHNSQLLTVTYLALTTSLFALYFFFLRVLPDKKIEWGKMILFSGLLMLPLLLSYNALSHDVFNYIFNAKMVVVYHANPHHEVALNFPQDDWTRFMHNTHTTAPYGYGWTAVSLVPFLLGLQKFVPTWLLFRFFSVISIVLTVLTLQFFSQRWRKVSVTVHELAFFLFNPLLLIEVISNAHNDLWMMSPALASLALALPSATELKKSRTLLRILTSLLLLLFSISIKFGTAVLIPVWFFLITQKFWLRHWLRGSTWILEHLPELASLALFLPLLTDRAQQFHPWYLTWVLVWVPLMRWKWWRNAVLVLSLSSLWRYTPWLLTGFFTDQVIAQQKMITWIPFGLYLLYMLSRTFLFRTLPSIMKR